MPFHHVALASRDTETTHRFYTEAMGFELVKVQAGKTPQGGWAKHFFYETGGGGMIAFWEIHDDAEVAEDWKSAISTGLGLPAWANHVAFRAKGLEGIEASKVRWLEFGIDVAEIDHGWCRSIYTMDPNGILVEFCTTTRTFDAQERGQARELLVDPSPEFASEPTAVFHRAKDYRQGR